MELYDYQSAAWAREIEARLAQRKATLLSLLNAGRSTGPRTRIFSALRRPTGPSPVPEPQPEG